MITISQVATLLGENTRRLKALCTSSKINKWSVRKPIAHSKIADLTDAEVLAADAGMVFGNAALTPYYSAESLLSVLKKGTKWTYTPPTGAYPNQPWRLGDFRGYVHRAGAWTNAQLEGDITFDDLSRSVRFTFGAFDTIQGDDTTGALSWRQCATWRDCYPCVCIFDNTGALYAYVTADKTISAAASDLTLTFGTGGIALTKNKKYTYLKCACTIKHTSATAIPEGTPTFAAIPCQGDTYGQLVYAEAVISLTATITGLATGTAVPTTWASPTKYTGVVEVGTVPTRYALAAGTLWLRVVLDSTQSNTDYIINALTAIASATLGGAYDAPGAATLYSVAADGTLTPKPSAGITIPAGSRKTIALSLGYLMGTTPDGSVGPVTDTSATCAAAFRLRFGDGSTLTAKPVDIRFKVQ